MRSQWLTRASNGSPTAPDSPGATDLAAALAPLTAREYRRARAACIEVTQAIARFQHADDRAGLRELKQLRRALSVALEDYDHHATLPAFHTLGRRWRRLTKPRHALKLNDALRHYGVEPDSGR